MPGWCRMVTEPGKLGDGGPDGKSCDLAELLAPSTGLREKGDVGSGDPLQASMHGACHAGNPARAAREKLTPERALTLSS